MTVRGLVRRDWERPSSGRCGRGRQAPEPRRRLGSSGLGRGRRSSGAAGVAAGAAFFLPNAFLAARLLG